MTVIRSGTQITGSVYDYNRLLGLSDEPCNVLFVSDQTKYILSNIAEAEVNWYSRYFNDILSNNRLEVFQSGDLQTGFIDRVAQNFRLQVIGDDLEIAVALQEIANALRESACCEGIGGNGAGGAGSEPVAPTTATDNGIDIPAGWSGTRAEYETYKCNWANYYLDQVDDALAKMQVLNWDYLITLSVTEAVIFVIAALGVAIPATPLAIAIGAILLYTGGIQALLQVIRDALSADREDLVCSLYTSSDINGAFTGFKTTLTAAIEAQSSDSVVRYLSGLIVDMFVTTDLLNFLFDENESIVVPTGTTDCSVCSLSPGIFYQLWTDGITNMGSGGPLVDDDVTRSYTGIVLGGNGKWTVGVYDAPTQASITGDCNDAAIHGTEAKFTFEVLTPLGGGGFNCFMSLCDSGGYSIVQGGGSLSVGTYVVSYVDMTFPPGGFGFDAKIRNLSIV